MPASNRIPICAALTIWAAGLGDRRRGILRSRNAAVMTGAGGRRFRFVQRDKDQKRASIYVSSGVISGMSDGSFGLNQAYGVDGPQQR